MKILILLNMIKVNKIYLNELPSGKNIKTHRIGVIVILNNRINVIYFD